MTSATYAGHRRIFDADSHLMERHDFLTRHAPAPLRDRLPPLAGGLTGLDLDVPPRTDAERIELISLGDDLIKRGPKWHAALGAVEGAERQVALDLFGFERQVVYSSLCWPLYRHDDAKIRYEAYRAHNRAMAEFCSADDRLIGAALCDLDDPERSLAVLDEALALGCGQVAIPAHAPGGASPGHPRNDKFWARLAERAVPFVLHVGAAPLAIAPAWTDIGAGDPDAPRQPQAEVISSKDLMVIHHPFVQFLTTLVLDGVLERFPGLRGGAIEVGAGWVPDMLRRLDHAVDIWARSEPRLAAFDRRPSEQAAQQLRFTPYAFEDVGRLLDQSPPGLYLFSSDYPHAEGGRDPIGRFERSLAGQSDEVVAGFFHGNATSWMA